MASALSGGKCIFIIEIRASWQGKSTKIYINKEILFSIDDATWRCQDPMVNYWLPI